MKSRSLSNYRKILLLVKQASSSGTWTEIAPNTWRARSVERHLRGDATEDHWVEPTTSSCFTVPRQTAQRRQFSERTTWPWWNGQQVGLGRETADGFLLVCHATHIHVTNIVRNPTLERTRGLKFKGILRWRSSEHLLDLVLFSWGNEWQFWQVLVGALVSSNKCVRTRALPKSCHVI